MNQPLVTIIVPCYNYGHFLKDTLNNVRQQEYQHWECLIVDDGSTDNTREVASAFVDADLRFRYLYQVNRGLSAARNHGIAQSNGVYIQFLDSDDFIHRSKIRQQVKLLEENKTFDLTYGLSLFFFNDQPDIFYQSRKKNNKRTSPLIQGSGKGRMIIGRLLINNIMEVSCALLRKELIIAAGVFDETMKSYEDWQVWIACAQLGAYFDFNPLPGTETYIRCGHTSMMSNKKNLVVHGIRVRKFLHQHLSIPQKAYNYFRLSKLYVRLWLKIF